MTLSFLHAILIVVHMYVDVLFIEVVFKLKVVIILVEVNPS